MFSKLLDLLGLSDNKETVVKSYREKRRQQRLNNMQNLDKIPHDREGNSFYGEAVPYEPEASGRMQTERITPPTENQAGPLLILVRGENCPEMLDDMEKALQDGKMVFIDLLGTTAEEAQQVVDTLADVVKPLHGSFYRITRSSFLASPIRGSVEEWALEPEDELHE